MNTTHAELPGEDLLPFDHDSMMEIPPIQEDFDEKVQQAQEQLLRLRHEQDLIEKQKAELESLSQQQEKFIEGRTQLVEDMNRSISTLEREAFESEKRVELFLHTKDSLNRHLQVIQSFNPEQWSREDLRGELTRALSAIEEAETDFHNATGRLSGMMDKKSPLMAASGVGLPSGFRGWFVSGFAFTLPIIFFAVIALFVWAFLSV